MPPRGLLKVVLVVDSTFAALSYMYCARCSIVFAFILNASIMKHKLFLPSFNDILHHFDCVIVLIFVCFLIILFICRFVFCKL